MSSKQMCAKVSLVIFWRNKGIIHPTISWARSPHDRHSVVFSEANGRNVQLFILLSLPRKIWDNEMTAKWAHMLCKPCWGVCTLSLGLFSAAYCRMRWEEGAETLALDLPFLGVTYKDFQEDPSGRWRTIQRNDKRKLGQEACPRTQIKEE